MQNININNLITTQLIEQQVQNALLEDVGQGDISAKLIDSTRQVVASIICREPIVLCGTRWVDAVFKSIDKTSKLNWYFSDGDSISANSKLCEVSGFAASLLTAERTALNFLQTLSATATTTQHYVNAIKDFPTKLLDTRKTIPGFRLSQKYAVHCGGGVNHRFGLYDAFLIKENHIKSCSSISNAVTGARAIDSAKLIEVEVENFTELKEVMPLNIDVVMLDNFSIADMKTAIQMVNGKFKLEASGNINLDNIANVAATGVDFISVGAITKNIQAIDLSMRII
ncbi:MAG: nicotinate-nucleotide diphosphorylase (carboxylating) [Thiotrichales bacterium]|nr:MAG: nicotinate-nucleotide diphosphorylase (carboxylating) [Thiotrichales bacterium]